MATVNLGAIRFNWKGAYNNGTAYVVDDVVSSAGNSYICILASTGNAVSNATYWSIMSSAGTNGTDGTDVGTTITTQGDVLYRDGSGLQRLAKGTAAQTLTMNSGATAPEWADAAGGGTVLLETYSNAANTTMDFTSFNHTLYDSYEIFFTFDPSGNNFNWQSVVSTNGGSSWDSSSVYENVGSKTFGNETESRYYGDGGGTNILFTGDVDNTAGVRVGGMFTLISPGDSYHTWIFYRSATYGQGGAGITMMHREGVARYKSTTAVNGFRVQTQSAAYNAAWVGRMYGRIK